MRVRTFARVLKKVVAPDLGIDEPQTAEVLKRLLKTHRIQISRQKWENWWVGAQTPQPKSRMHFESDAKLKELLRWLDPQPFGNPFQRHFCAIDALIHSESHKPEVVKAAERNAELIIGSLDRLWGGKDYRDHHAFLDTIYDLEYLHPGDSTDAVNDMDGNIIGRERPDYRFIKFEGIYHPFDPNSVISLMLAIGIDGMRSLRYYRHWVLDFATAILCSYVLVHVRKPSPALWEATDLGKAAEWVTELLEEQDISFDRLWHNTKRYPFSFKVETGYVIETLLKLHEDYGTALTSIGIERTSIRDQWIKAFTGPENLAIAKAEIEAFASKYVRE